MGGGRAPCCDKSKVKRGPWSPAEDLRLMNFIQKNGHDNWRALPKQAGLLRCGKSCRLRWINYLRPDVKRGNFTPEEEQTIINLHNSFGNKWSKIAAFLPGRTDNEIKNVWNTHLKKRLISKKIPKDCQKSGAKNSKTTNCSTSPSSSSSSITVSEEQDTDKSHHRQKLHECNAVEPDDTPEPKETSSYDSLTSSCGSNFSSSASGTDNASRTNELSGFPRPGTINHENFSNNEEIVIPIFESKTDIWELMDSLDPLLSTESEHNVIIQDSNQFNHEENLNSDDECRKWLRFLENELGLTNDSDSVPKDQDHVTHPTTNPQYQGMNLEAEINPQLHNFSKWSQDVGI